MRYLVIAALLCACGKSERPSDRGSATPVVADATIDAGSPTDTPEQLARSFLTALASGEPDRVRALYMTPEQVTALVRCDKDPVLELREHLFEVEKQLGPTSSEVAFVRWEQDGRSVQKAGTSERGCTAKRDFELALGSVRFTVTTRKGTERDSKILAFVRVTEGWRVWRMSAL
ncbi:MAG: hypothetical protein WKG01_20360 [Kofleriaceae bacterium]